MPPEAPWAEPHRLAIHLDAVGGIAGDMFAAGMLDALPALQPRVLADIAAVLPAAAGSAALEAGESGGLRALRLRLGQAADHPGHHAQEGVPHGGAAGTFRAMADRLRAARLSPGTADQAVAILTRIGEAEAALHGVPLDRVHFHEIAGWDSLMDVVAAGSIAAALAGARWSVSDLPLGRGLVRTQHGLLPVPAPATAALLAGFAWRDDGIGGERVTPTGAAILRHLIADPATPRQPGRLLASGSGAGTRSLPGLPNILRVLVFAAGEDEPAETVTVLSFDVDDMTGEEVGVAAERLRALPGVLDLTLVAAWGKKGRPVQGFRLLLRPGALEIVAERCFAETSTIGLRWREERRRVLPRAAATAAVGGAAVRLKRVTAPDGACRVKAESDDLAGAGSLAARRALKALAERAPE